VHPGDLVGGRFAIDQQVGAGGMGVVYRARDATTGGLVAIKVFAWRTATEVARAQREVQLLDQLRHPAIVGHIADGVTPDGQLYLVMDWIAGTTVADRLEAEGTTVAEAIAIARPIASALAFAHDAGVIHRDVKPSNVVLEGNEPALALLIDFGIARLMDSVTSLTKTGMSIGTPGYMSPEQARGADDLTPAIDVFGLGCLLYECVTGKPAFTGANAASVMSNILFAQPAPIRDACPEAPDALVALIDRMLKKPIVQRIPECGTVLQLLAEIVDIPAGPRRNSRGVAPYAASRAAFHCIVAAAQGAIDDVLPPPGTDACRRLAHVAAAHDGAMEVLATGTVITQLAGEPRDVTHRAAELALAFREILPTWAISISSASMRIPTSEMFDAGTRLLNAAAMAAINRRAPDALHIRIDAETAALLRDDYELGGGNSPRLVRRK
jgi:hypothetical protein